MSSIKSSPVIIKTIAPKTLKADKFNEYESVELSEVIEVNTGAGKVTLKKGEKGAVMMAYIGDSESVYEIDFVHKKLLAPVAESKLLAAFDTDW